MNTLSTPMIKVSDFVKKCVARGKILVFIDEFLKYTNEPSWELSKDSFYSKHILFEILKTVWRDYLEKEKENN